MEKSDCGWEQSRDHVGWKFDRKMQKGPGKGAPFKGQRRDRLDSSIVTLEHLELDWHRKAVGKRIKSYEVVSANSQEADPLKQKLARRGDGELSKQIHQSNQILQIFQAGTGNACNWANCGIETKGKIVYDCSLGKIFILSRKSSRRSVNRENEKGEKKKEAVGGARR